MAGKNNLTPSAAVLHCDGASSGNPGESGIGVIIDYGDRTYEISENIGFATNNIAEYRALIRGLSEAKALGIENVDIFLDSELLVRQLDGSYRVKNVTLQGLHSNTVLLLKYFKSYKIKHIPREENRKADSLAKKALKKTYRTN